MVFTSGGTEADNLALKGLFWSRRDADPRRVRILASSIEHHAVLDALDWLVEEEQADVELLPVDRQRPARPRRPPRRPSSATRRRSPLISVMWANNEVGTLQPIEEIVAVAAPHGIPVHTDAVQAVGAVPVDFAASGVDALTLTGHKLGGPYGVGALVLRRELSLTPLLHGGGQERDIRSGTLDMPGDRRLRHRGRACRQGPARVRRAGRRPARRPGPPGDRGRARRPPPRRPRRTGCPATPTSASPTARATRC